MRRFVLSVGGLGFLPGAPGTYATVVTLGVYLLGVHVGAPWWVWPAAAAISGGLLLVVGVPEDERGGADPRWCVLDEVCGTLVAVTGQPTHSPMVVTAGVLVLFRLFDVLKPPPINLLERLGGSRGVLADDVAAGALANGCVWLLRLLVGHF